MEDADAKPERKPSEKNEEPQIPNSYLPYPVSRLSPPIVPSSSSAFKSQGMAQVQKEAAVKLDELKEQYERIVDEFNWNKLIYESVFSFEPVVGETYHLYLEESRVKLSLIEPERWPRKRYLASVRLQARGQWKLVRKADGFNLREFLNGASPSEF